MVLAFVFFLYIVPSTIQNQDMSRCMNRSIASLLVLFLLQGASAQSDRSPYQRSWSIDGAIIGTSLTAAVTASLLDDELPILTRDEISRLDKRTINPLDRLTAGWYSKEQSTVSDVLVGSAILSPLLFVLDERTREDIGTIGTMYLETIMFATFMPSFGKGNVRRVRPFVYGSPAPMSLKEDVESLRSFYSGHATWAFATSIFFASVYTDHYPDSEHAGYVWGGAIGLASTVSLLRVTSGAHFLSDIAVGAAVGTAIGLAIPALHRTGHDGWSITPHITPVGSGARFTLSLK